MIISRGAERSDTDMGDAVRGAVRVDRINRWPSAGPGVGRLKLAEQRAIAW